MSRDTIADIDVNTTTSEALINPTGVLAVHVKKMTNIAFKNDISDVTKIYFRISVGDICHTTTTVPVNHQSTLLFDNLRHYHCKVDPKKDALANRIHLQLYGVLGLKDPENPFDIHRILAAKTLNLLDIIRTMYASENITLERQRLKIGQVTIEFCFAYGSFGYGYSNQIASPTYTLSSEENLSHSMFLRLEPPSDRKLHNLDILAPQYVPHPKFMEFDEHIRTPTKIRGSHFSSKKDEDRAYPLLFETIKKPYMKLLNEFNDCTSREHRIDFLHNLISLNMRKREPENSSLYVKLDPIEFDEGSKSTSQIFKSSRHPRRSRTMPTTLTNSPSSSSPKLP
ncbi:hypothetical protein SNEBB_004899 [Seison nebaliae]|nr:hypothetical protein SNEBB_004899 [Seison nebaliae]